MNEQLVSKDGRNVAEANLIEEFEQVNASEKNTLDEELYIKFLKFKHKKLKDLL